MVAMLGYSGQAVMTGVGPFQNLQDHIGNPSARLCLLTDARAWAAAAPQLAVRMQPCAGWRHTQP